MSSSTAPPTTSNPSSTSSNPTDRQSAAKPSNSEPLPTASPTSTPKPTIEPRTLHIGTRASALALAQTTLFTSLLPPHLPTQTHPTTTTGDHIQNSPLHTLAQAGKSLWTEELETLLLDRKIDCIVHSLKDVPTKLPTGCKVYAVGPRAAAGDVVVMRQGREGGATTLADLPPGAVVGTSSVRRAAMIRRSYPHLSLADVRGNIGTRLRKLDAPAPTSSEGEAQKHTYDCLVLAGAGLLRLDLGHRISSWLSSKQGMMCAVGQGAVGVEVREGDSWVEGILAAPSVRHRRVGWECIAERGLLRAVEGGCSVPVGVETVWEDVPAQGEPDADREGGEPQDDEDRGSDKGKGILTISAIVVSLDGAACVEGSRRQLIGSDEEAEECGWELAKALVERGAEKILKEIGLNRGMIRGQDGA